MSRDYLIDRLFDTLGLSIGAALAVVSTDEWAITGWVFAVLMAAFWVAQPLWRLIRGRTA